MCHVNIYVTTLIIISRHQRMYINDMLVFCTQAHLMNSWRGGRGGGENASRQIGWRIYCFRFCGRHKAEYPQIRLFPSTYFATFMSAVNKRIWVQNESACSINSQPPPPSVFLSLCLSSSIWPRHFYFRVCVFLCPGSNLIDEPPLPPYTPRKWPGLSLKFNQIRGIYHVSPRHPLRYLLPPPP